MKKVILLGLCLLAVSPTYAQRDSSLLSTLLEDYQIKTSVGLQLWATHAQNMQVFDPVTEKYLPVDNRTNVQLRRSRFTISGRPYSTLQFKVTGAVDLVGHDVLAATEAGGNNGSSPTFRIWNAYLNWQLTPQKDLVYFTAGYFVSPIGRESNTAAVRSTSFEKAWSQNYLRRHLTGIGPGRAMGLMVGGQFAGASGKPFLTYEVALQNPVFEAYDGNSTGAASSPLLTGRISAQIGDPENEQYSLSHKVNYFGQRQGLTISIAAAHQGATDCFNHNSAYGVELLYNHSAFHLDGEYFFLQRSGTDRSVNIATTAATGYLRLGKNFSLPRAMVLEPVVSYWFFHGAETLDEISQANLLGSFSGNDAGLDLGANLYFNPNTKLSLFYARRTGNAGAGAPQLTNNNFFQQPGVGAIRRGSYFGAGWVVIF